ncbi:probable 28S ribosomal protein S23, mitochondrial isoform X1 [Osmia bicornis bicornis]|uniref:probable 28S ribosomal protein S23, mitochondrial isoform X1 n=1 Tax=Osmia bicornis bicornis TaxID=1437191 RepID=UPI0010F8F8A3|nr:probable 28S ribosomal protein S23, mitochondrial isoform X1 [Osmia bicornis bicornis]
MAHSRTERIGTIFSRVTALWKSKAIKEENLPLWYNIYKTFPPKYEPRFDRPAPQKSIRNIFYEEDIVRAKFQKDVTLPAIDLKSDKLSQTQLFYIIYANVKRISSKEKEEDIYIKVLEIYERVFGTSAKRRQNKSSDDDMKKT